MQIIKKRLKNKLSNKIIKSQLTPFTILYIINNSTQTLTNTIKKKNLTKLLFKNNFKNLNSVTHIYPISYISELTLNLLIKKYLELKNHKDFQKIIIYNIQIKNLIFKKFSLLEIFNIQNPINNYYKLYILLNQTLYSYIFIKNLNKLNKK